jgi:hypothetical protein
MQSSTRHPLARRSSPVEQFGLTGCLDGMLVRAEWDGRWIEGSAILLERAELAMAVDRVFDDFQHAGAGTDEQPTPEQLLLALVTCCDEIDAVEYDVHGRHRLIGP